MLKRAGKSFSGLCPFHDDKNPSFSVDPATGRYRCWSCNESGDVFTWVMKTQSVDFVEALKILADRAGIQLSKREGPTSDHSQHRAAMAEAFALFKESLAKDPAALQYCEGRGIDKETIQKWGIGYAPANGEDLTVRLKRAGLPLALGKDLFLVDQNASGGYYDRFRGRLMFPIYDERSELVAFGGRLLGDGHPKYINSSDTPLYRKSRVLYGAQIARTEIMATRKAVLVEGYLDAIACHRSGVTNSVASLGTALSEEHCHLLKRWCDEVTILYDSDAAGQKAVERAIPMLLSEGLRVRIALITEGKDPDTLLREQGSHAVAQSVGRGISPATFKLRQLEQRLSPETDDFWTGAIEIVSESNEELDRERNLLTLAGKYPHVRDVGLALSRLTKLVDERRRPVRKQPGRPQSRTAIPRSSLKEGMIAAETIVFGALHEPSFQKSAWIALRTPAIFVTGSAVDLANAVITAFPDAPPEGLAVNWIHRVEPEALRQLLSDVHLDPRTENLSEEVIIDSINSLKKLAVDRDLRSLRRSNLTAEERQEILLRVRQLNPDLRARTQDDEDDPFS